MELKAYFEGVKGTGVIATADSKGKVNMAIYSKPILWIMVKLPLS